MNSRKKGRQLAKKFSLVAGSRRIAEADSVAVIGLGRFGSAIALELMASGTEVLGIDASESIVQGLSGKLTQVVRADSSREEVLRQLAVDEFDRVVVSIGEDLSASILTCSTLIGMGVPEIWAKVADERHGIILKQLGVQHVVFPEHDMGKKVAHLVRGAALDYIEVDSGLAMVKVAAPEFLRDRPLSETALRTKHGVTVASYLREGQGWQNAESATVLQEGDTILVVGSIKNSESFAQLQ
jgi:trk system potassium uptake protein TrkA